MQWMMQLKLSTNWLEKVEEDSRMKCMHHASLAAMFMIMIIAVVTDLIYNILLDLECEGAFAWICDWNFIGYDV